MLQELGRPESWIIEGVMGICLVVVGIGKTSGFWWLAAFLPCWLAWLFFSGGMDCIRLLFPGHFKGD